MRISLTNFFLSVKKHINDDIYARDIVLEKIMEISARNSWGERSLPHSTLDTLAVSAISSHSLKI